MNDRALPTCCAIGAALSRPEGATLWRRARPRDVSHEHRGCVPTGAQLLRLHGAEAVTRRGGPPRASACRGSRPRPSEIPARSRAPARRSPTSPASRLPPRLTVRFSAKVPRGGVERMTENPKQRFHNSPLSEVFWDQRPRRWCARSTISSNRSRSGARSHSGTALRASSRSASISGISRMVTVIVASTFTSPRTHGAPAGRPHLLGGLPAATAALADQQSAADGRPGYLPTTPDVPWNYSAQDYARWVSRPGGPHVRLASMKPGDKCVRCSEPATVWSSGRALCRDHNRLRHRRLRQYRARQRERSRHRDSEALARRIYGYVPRFIGGPYDGQRADAGHGSQAYPYGTPEHDARLHMTMNEYVLKPGVRHYYHLSVAETCPLRWGEYHAGSRPAETSGVTSDTP
jgi:hypothetical protein